VFTPVIRVDLKKIKNKNEKTLLVTEGNTNFINQNTFNENTDFTFSVHVNKADHLILKKIESLPHTNLKNKADWALGVVTGDNKKYLSNKKDSFNESILIGKDILKYTYRNPTQFIKFEPDKFQQVAPAHKLRVREKLVYRFISKELVFAYDDKELLTLNSANILVPNVPNYPIKVILALLNSSLYQYVFQKKVGSIKVLRSHTEELPLPFWEEKLFSDIIIYVNKILKPDLNVREKKVLYSKIDDLIMSGFELSVEEIAIVKNGINKSEKLLGI
jgi:hypothetical protein